MQHQFRYQDFIDEQRAGGIHGVFIDDTGSPGLRDTPRNLHPERKSWVAVVVSRSDIAEVWKQFPAAIAELTAQTGASEFHFADVYGRRGAFKKVPLEKRLAIFGFMASIFDLYKFPIFVQTLDPVSLQDVCDRATFPERFGPFDCRKHEDLALLFLLLRVKRYLEDLYPPHLRRARVFVDEGFLPNGRSVFIEPLQNTFADGLICFGRSNSIMPIQLADFAAFCLNRTQLLLGRPKISPLDQSLLQIIEPIAWNYQDIPRVAVKDWFPNDESLN